MSVKQKDVQTILEFNGIVRNYVKMKRIESRVELNEEIIINNTESGFLSNLFIEDILPFLIIFVLFIFLLNKF